VSLDVAFIERALTDDAGNLLPAASQPPTFDYFWRPDTSTTGGYEMIVVLARPYGTTPAALIQRDGAIADGSLPALYALWARRRAAADSVTGLDFFQFDWAVPATSNDVFQFDTTPLVRNDLGAARGGLDDIRVVPNPYRYESRYDRPGGRVVRFINMPEQAVVRIFNLGGGRVRTLVKSDPGSVLEWDLLTEHGKRLASGIYVYYIEVPGNVGTVHGRLAVLVGE
jgi:hypothetical protein